MGYNLDNNNELVEFFNVIFKNEDLTDVAPTIMKFFILTRNYGLKKFDEYIYRIVENEDFFDVVIDAITNGFKDKNIEFNNRNLIMEINKNYYENGFYFHNFPGVYADNIREKGLLATNRNQDDSKFYEIVKKYHFGKYFEKTDKRICVTSKLDEFVVSEYALFTPEWLEMFLKIGNGDIREGFESGDLNQMLYLTQNAFLNIKIIMKECNDYNENDFLFLEKYINNIVYNRFKAGNNHIGIAFIPRKMSQEFFGENKTLNDIDWLEKNFKEKDFSKEKIIDFLVNVIPVGEMQTNKDIPNNMFGIVEYDVQRYEMINDKDTIYK